MNGNDKNRFKHRRVLGKDFCHRKCVLLALTSNLANGPLLLRQLAFLVFVTLLLSSSRPDMRRRYEFCGFLF